jgi:urease accessory protein
MMHDAGDSWPSLPDADAEAPAGGQVAALDVDVVRGASVAHTCLYRYPLKLLLLPSNVSVQPASGGGGGCGGSGSTPQRPLWCFVATFGGGLLAGDVTRLAVRLRCGATAVLCTQASTKVYHARAADAGAPPRPPACAAVVAGVAAGALLAHLPEPTVCFADARYRARFVARLQPGGSVALVDWFTSGRSAAGEAWAFASYSSRTTLELCSTAAAPPLPLLIEALQLTACAVAPLAERMGDAHVFGTLVLFGPRVAAAAAAILLELRECAPLWRTRARTAQPFFFAAGAALEPPQGMLGDWGGAGCAVRFAAASAEEAADWVRAALAPLHCELGGEPFRM